MNLTKDEARILASAMEIAKYEFNHLPDGAFSKLSALEKKLEIFGKDQRRTGRTTQDDYSDCLKRFSKAVR
jgi:hypothetical protein